MHIPKKSLNIFFLFGIILTILFIIQANTRVQSASSTQYTNLFALKACLDSDPVFCPGGVFNDAAFDQMYLNPSLNPQHYPGGGTGVYTREEVPLCETQDCAGDTIRCTDGTRPIYYYKPGTGADADKWIIRIQGGGDTCGAGNCGYNYLTSSLDDFSSAHGDNQLNRNAQGILSNRPDNLFRNYNLVLMDKCVGDRNLGDVTIPDYTYGPNADGAVYFHGFRIIKGVLQALKTQTGAAPDLEDAGTIAFMTQSNGTNGAYLYKDRLHQYVVDEIAAPGSIPDVRFLASSFVHPGPELEYAFSNPNTGFPMPGFYPDAYGHVDSQTTSATICGNGFDPNDPYYQDWLDQGMQVNGFPKCNFGVGNDHLRGIGSMFFSTADYSFGREADYLTTWGANDDTPTIDESCYAAHLLTGDVEACNDSSHVMLYHLTTPTFFGAQAGDRNLRTGRLASWTVTFDPALCDPGDQNCHDENYRGDTDVMGNPVPSEGSWQKEEFQERVYALMDERFNSQSAYQEQPGGLGHGAFIDNTVEHSSYSRIEKLLKKMKPADGAAALELQEYLFQWLDPTNQLQVVCVDEGPLYDSEFAPPVVLSDAPAGLVCDTGPYYDPNIPVDPEQRCNDPFNNTASTNFACMVVPAYDNYLPLIISSSS